MSTKQYFYFKFKAMGSPCELQLACLTKSQAEKIFTLVKKRVNELEKRYSRFTATSLVTKINNAAGNGKKISIDAETYALLLYAQQCYEESDGLFDITSGILRKVWNFQHHAKQTDNQLTIAGIQEKIDQFLPLVDWQQVTWDKSSIALNKKNMQLDFGGIVKEYCADCIKELCLKNDISSGMINMGGDICIIGPLLDGTGWPVALQHPTEKSEKMASLNLVSGALASSGDYERYIVVENQHFSHVINPKTGWPVSGVKSISVTAPHCIIAGSLATIAMLKGEQGANWIKDSGANYLCCLKDGAIEHNF